MKYTEWNWDTACGSTERIAWLKAHYNKEVSFEEYLAMVDRLPHDHKRRSKCILRSNNLRAYEYLKKRFGFFTGELA